MKLSSLRVRVGLGYAVFTVSCLTLFGIFLTVYLGQVLESSRPASMVDRAARLIAFTGAEHNGYAKRPLDETLNRFIEVSPDTSEIIVRSPDGQKLLLAAGDQPFLLNLLNCSAPCYQEVVYSGHPIRTYTVEAKLAGNLVKLTMAGRVDEHYGILHTVRTSYLLFVPFLVLASLAGGYVFSNRALLPVGRMTAMASRLSISDLRGRVPVPRTGDELQSLAEAWNSMLARLQTAMERNAQFTSDASHDLRTSMAVMLASTQLGLNRERTAEEYRKLLGKIASECEHTLTLLEDLLISARFGSEQYHLAQETLDLAEIVRESCGLFIHQAEAKNQSLTFALASQCWIRGDRSLMHRMIAVLVENAIKYTAPGGSISVQLVREKNTAILEVSDTGSGISATDLPRIFDRHFRSSASRRTQRGNGLGLHIARSIAEAHGAPLTVESELNKGSIFRVSLPRVESEIRKAFSMRVDIEPEERSLFS
ncbi:sensor histidine kinase [Acidicapsa dinghuensis]|uniref:histidine kinase n=1 Tax=Acidicapsa dinghuensis TaxID=2218256 RepID=A0ABW1EJQ0_9BACT|nr:HAMP domain-containing histidine kinase [Acidicapsa dinghuensis]